MLAKLVDLPGANAPVHQRSAFAAMRSQVPAATRRRAKFCPCVRCLPGASAFHAIEFPETARLPFFPLGLKPINQIIAKDQRRLAVCQSGQSIFDPAPDGSLVHA